MNEFQGLSLVAIDAKGRIAVPARHRDGLITQCEGKLTVTRHPDGCLVIYQREAWKVRRMEIDAFPSEARPLKRMLLGSAVDLDVDASGRFLLPPELRAAAKLDKTAELRGMGKYYELWDPALLTECEQRSVESGEMARLANLYC